MEIRNKIVILLREKKLTQKEIAKHLNMTAANFSQILKGKQSFTEDMLIKMKRVLPELDLNSLAENYKEGSVAEERQLYEVHKTEREKYLENKLAEIIRIAKETQN